MITPGMPLMSRLLRSLAIAVALFNGAAGAAAQTRLAYGAANMQGLDLYEPAGKGPFPLVVYVHGGGWVRGNRASGKAIAPPLNDAGYAVASIDYRKVPNVSVDTEMEDAALAIAYLLNNAASLRLQPNRFALLGHSSGGHMVALLATDQTYLTRAGVDPHKLAAVIVLDGVYDVAANVTRYPSTTRKEVFGTDPQVWKLLSPTRALGKMQSHPAFYLLHEDTLPRFIEQAGLFEQALRAAGENVHVTTAPGLKHGELVSEFDQPGTPMLPFALDCLRHYLAAPASH
jgi:acetyl esterase/lipase